MELLPLLPRLPSGWGSKLSSTLLAKKNASCVDTQRYQISTVEWMKFFSSQGVIMEKTSPWRCSTCSKKQSVDVVQWWEIKYATLPFSQSLSSLRFQTPKCGAGPQPGIVHMQNSVKMLIWFKFLGGFVRFTLTLSICNCFHLFSFSLFHEVAHWKKITDEQ